MAIYTPSWLAPTPAKHEESAVGSARSARSGRLTAEIEGALSKAPEDSEFHDKGKR